MITNEVKDGICILSFDNGGPGTYSQLLILKECVIRLASDLQVAEEDVYPADYFDLMGGVGFGGFVALMLGLLRMNVDEAIERLLDVASIVFPEVSEDTVDPVMNMKNLKEAVEGILQTRNVALHSKMNEVTRAPTRCKVALFAATSANITHPHIFRTYPFRGSSLNPTIVDAVCATMAMHSHFSPMKIGPRMRQQSFVGGALGSHNPTRILLDEAGMIFGKERRLTQIISLGCGLPRVLSVGLSDEPNVHRLLREITTDCETLAHELSTRLFNVDAYARLNVDRGMEPITMDDWSVLGDIESHTAAYLATAGVSAVVENSVRHLRERIATITLGQIGQSSSIKIAAKQAPSVSPHFVVRKKPWETMIRHLVTNATSRRIVFPITGMGGCGKTQMVSYFLQEHPSLYKYTVYVDAGSSSSIEADLQTWARTLGDGHESDVWEDALRILSSVPQNEQWALILDNADDPTLNIVPFLPKGANITIIITSRNRDIGNLATTFHLELGEMSAEEALATLLQAARRQPPISPEEMESLNALIKELGCLAVALVQAGTYCYQMSATIDDVLQPYTFTQYLSLFNSHRAELMKKAEPTSLDSYERGVYTTLDLSYKALPHTSAEFLHLISFFHHTSIPLEAFATAAKKSFHDPHVYLARPLTHQDTVSELENLLYTDSKWSDLKVQGLISNLRSFSLLTASMVNDSIFLHLHPLVQSWSKDMKSPVSQRYQAMAIQVLTTCGNEESFTLNLRVLPHILNILDQIEQRELHVNSLMSLGVVIKQQGQYKKATGLFEAALRIMESDKPNDTNTLMVKIWVSNIYISERKLGEAEKLLVEVLEQSKRAWGPEHPDTITASAHLASTHRYQGRWNDAERLQLEVLEQRRRILGIEHPETIRATANLAATYHSQGRWSDAEELVLEVLEQRRRILGIEHPGTIRAAANLAAAYGKQDRWEEGLGLLVPAVQLSLKVLGQQHPDAQVRVNSLAYVYERLGKAKEAQDMKDLLL